jgi:hypothetical protein
MASNITSINVEGNLIRHLPSALPRNLKTLRLGGNPIAGVGISGAERQHLLELLEGVPQLETFSVSVARGTVGDAPADGSRYVVTKIGGMSQVSDLLTLHPVIIVIVSMYLYAQSSVWRGKMTRSSSRGKTTVFACRRALPGAQAQWRGRTALLPAARSRSRPTGAMRTLLAVVSSCTTASMWAHTFPAAVLSVYLSVFLAGCFGLFLLMVCSAGVHTHIDDRRRLWLRACSIHGTTRSCCRSLLIVIVIVRSLFQSVWRPQLHSSDRPS